MLKVAILGAGGRGWGFARLINSLAPLAKETAVAEPREHARKTFAAEYGIDGAQVFNNWREFCAAPKQWDAVVISTMDQDHSGPALACLAKGYAVLLEKPMATTLEECEAIEAAQRASGAIVAVCHSMRYHSGFSKVRELVAEGKIGRLMGVDQIEQVAYWHYVHSYVRGKWGVEKDSSFMLLAKSCHDIDYLSALSGLECLRVSSFGSLSHFKKENAPQGSTPYCMDGCAVEESCAFSAKRLYAGQLPVWISPLPPDVKDSPEARTEALRKGPYGRCVYLADNDVVDHQVVILEYIGGLTATFTMTGFTQNPGRKIRVHGTEGEIEFEEGGLPEGDKLLLKRFSASGSESIPVPAEEGGHGGGDDRVVQNWLRAIQKNDPSLVMTNAQESLKTHRIVFAAERARLENRVVTLKGFQ
ncbi:MAG: Gfo/Idh/MocA family oxidoreductase [candidate division FCPU426 bacterium]